MKDINIKIIATGSTGNAVCLNGQILIDCGVTFSKLAQANVIDGLKFIFLTHQHKDHLNLTTIRKIISVRPTVKLIYPDYLCKPISDFCSSFSYDNSFLIKSSFIIPSDTMQRWYKAGNIMFSCFPLKHDVLNVGYKLHFSLVQGIYKVIFATDTSSLDNVVAKNYDLYLIEANYEKDELTARIKEKRAAGEFVYEDRVLKTHLSKEKADDWIYQNIGQNGQYIYLHGHKEKDNKQ